MKEAARVIREMGPENVVVKGGHHGLATDFPVWFFPSK
jgi:hydroxymethylpyrimidine/phosphomethylpyrimidine kinase